MPLPVSAMDCGLSGTVSEMSILALRLPVTAEVIWHVVRRPA